MTQPFGPLDPLMGGLFYFISVVFMLFMFAALPILVLVAIRFLWYRHVYVGRSQELEKLIWQLHRIASALEKPAALPVADLPETDAHTNGPVHLSMFGR